MGEGPKVVIKMFEGSFGENDQSANMSSRSKIQKSETVQVDKFYSWQVSGGKMVNH
jgi:hypothetical protein